MLYERTISPEVLPSVAKDVSDTALREFRDQIKSMFKSEKEAFAKLGGDDARIDVHTLRKFLCEELNLPDDERINKLFNTIDANGDGIISPAEFKAVFRSRKNSISFFVSATFEQPLISRQSDLSNPELLELRDKLKGMCRTFENAFNKLGGCYDARIDKHDFCRFFREELGQDDERIGLLFDLIDHDGDGFLEPSEFKAFFDVPAPLQPRKPRRLSSLEPAEGISDVTLIAFLRQLENTFATPEDVLAKLGRDDARIDEQAFRRFLRANLESLIINDARAWHLFKMIDTNGDGIITPDDIKALFKKSPAAEQEFSEASLIEPSEFKVKAFFGVEVQGLSRQMPPRTKSWTKSRSAATEPKKDVRNFFTK
jgi:Ca2+-binding EF-hand superfamily protein